jgi:hypothetical protein
LRQRFNETPSHNFEYEHPFTPERSGQGTTHEWQQFSLCPERGCVVSTSRSKST